MAARFRVIEMAIDMDLATLLLDGAGLILEVQALRHAGNLTEIHDPSDEQLSRLVPFLDKMKIKYLIAEAGFKPNDLDRRPRHSAP